MLRLSAIRFRTASEWIAAVEHAGDSQHAAEIRRNLNAVYIINKRSNVKSSAASFAGLLHGYMLGSKQCVEDIAKHNADDASGLTRRLYFTEITSIAIVDDIVC